MDLKHEKKNEFGQYPAILTSHFIKVPRMFSRQTKSFTVSPGLYSREIRAEQETGTKFNKMVAVSMFTIVRGD